MRRTKQKDLILNIVNSSCIHPNAYQIYELARGKIANISLGTVYRNLNMLVESGMIKEIKMPDHTTRYDKINPFHAHFLCYNCNKVLDLSSQNISYPKPKIEGMILDYEFSFKGICCECLKDKGGIKNGTKGK